MRNSCPTKEGKWAISCIALIRCQACRLQQLLLQYYWNPDETTTKFSTLKKTQLLRSQNVFKLHYIARKLARIYWTSNFQMTQKKTQQQQHHITYIHGTVLIIVSRMPASAEVRNSTILRGGRGKKKKKTTTTSDLRKEKREEKKKRKTRSYENFHRRPASTTDLMLLQQQHLNHDHELLQQHNRFCSCMLLLLAPSGYSLTSCNQQASSLSRMKRKIEL